VPSAWSRDQPVAVTSLAYAGRVTTNSLPQTSLREIAAVFLRLGLLGFGGPAAHIAMMEDELVRRRGWLTRERFLDLLGATNLIPGPNSTEMAIHIGRERAGWRGLLIAGACFILPAFAIVLACAWAYVRFGERPAARGLFYGVAPVMVAVVLQAVWSLARTAMRTRALAVVAVVALGTAAVGIDELMVLVGSGLVLAGWTWARQRRSAAAGIALPGVARLAHATSAIAVPVAGPSASVGLLPLFLIFLKTGAVLFGSGYVLLAYLRADLVLRRGWLTDAQLLDAVAVGQLTPGPVLTTATFVGYLLAGAGGAITATVGIFAPAFVFVALSSPLLPRLRRSVLAGGFLDGVNAASVALMALVTVALARAAIVDPATATLAAAAAVLLIRFRVSVAWLVPAGAVAGLLLRGLR